MEGGRYLRGMEGKGRHVGWECVEDSYRVEGEKTGREGEREDGGKKGSEDNIRKVPSSPIKLLGVLTYLHLTKSRVRRRELLKILKEN